MADEKMELWARLAQLRKLIPPGHHRLPPDAAQTVGHGERSVRGSTVDCDSARAGSNPVAHPKPIEEGLEEMRRQSRPDDN